MKNTGLVLLACLFCLSLTLSPAALNAQGKKDKEKPKKSKTKNEAGKGGEKSAELQVTIAGKFIDASTKLAQGLTDEAVKDFQTVIDLDDKNHASNYHLAVIFLEKGNYSKAESYAERAVELQPANQFYYEALKNIYLKQNKVKEAAATLEEAVKNCPKEIEFALELSDLYLKLEKYKEVLALYDLIEKKTGLVELIGRQRKDVYLFLNRPDDAVAALKKLVDANPGNMQNVYELYDLLVRLKREPEAVQMLEKLLADNPNESGALFRLVEYYEGNGNEAKARELADRAFKNPGVSLEAKMKYISRQLFVYKKPMTSVEPLVNLMQKQYPKSAGVTALRGDLYNAAGKPDSAIFYYRKSVELEPSNKLVWQNLLQRDLDMLRYQELMTDSKQAMEVFPNEPTIKYYNGLANYQLKNYEEAVYVFDRLVNFDITDPVMKTQLLTLLGDSYHYLKQYKKSDAAFHQALKNDPGNLTAMNNYAYFLTLREEKLDSAAYFIEKAIAKEPNNSSFQDTYGWVLYKQGKYKDALTWVEKAYQQGSTSEICDHLGDIYSKMGDSANAVKFWKEAKEKGLKSDELERKISAGKL